MPTHLPGNKCPNCGYPLDGAAPANAPESDVSPKEGDLSVCINCGTILQFDANIQSRIFPIEELFELPDDFRLDIMRHHRAVMRLIESRDEWDREDVGPTSVRSKKAGTGITRSDAPKTKQGN